jgi:radical SAM mobile pair protein B
MKEILIKEIEVKSVMTKSSLPVGGYSANPYIGCTHACKYCYASFMKRFTGHTEEWGTFLDVKHWSKIKNPHKYDGERVVIGSVTDGYLPQEETFRRTRTLLEELMESSAKILICTKSDLVLRDVDILKKMKNVTVSWSINTLDEAFKNDMDNAVSIERRLNAMRKLYDEGIRTVCFISPVFPEITDVPAIVERVRNQCDFVWIENLNLRGGFKADILDFVKNAHPELMYLYNEIYSKKNRTYFDELGEWIRNYCIENGNPYEDNHLPEGRMEKGKPMLINYLFHEEVRDSENKGTRRK